MIGVRRGAAPSELAKGVQGETAAIGRVSLHPFLYAAPRERAGVAKERVMRYNVHTLYISLRRNGHGCAKAGNGNGDGVHQAP